MIDHLVAHNQPSRAGPICETQIIRSIAELLEVTSRSFALSIPAAPPPVDHETMIASLFFRVADTFEDATSEPVGDPASVSQTEALARRDLAIAREVAEVFVRAELPPAVRIEQQSGQLLPTLV
jgi:phytoene/squalene synthetase